MRLCSLVATALFASAPLAAQPIETDRPDFTENTSVVAVGRVQIEAGTTLGVDTAFDETETTLGGPEALVRIGLRRGVEARLVLPDATAPFTSRARLGRASLSEPAFGFKAEVGPPGGLDVAAILEISVFENPNPRAVLIVGRTVGPSTSVGGQIEASYDFGTLLPFLGGTLVGGIGLSERVGTFAEFAVSSQSEGVSVLIHHGYTLLLSDTLQLDAHGGLGLTEDAPDVFAGLGAAVRF